MSVATQLINLSAALLLLVSFAMLSQRRVRALIDLFAVQGALLAVATLLAAWSTGQPHLYASAALTIVPRFPGSCMPSQTTRKGTPLKAMFPRAATEYDTTAAMPCGVSVSASRERSCSGISRRNASGSPRPELSASFLCTIRSKSCRPSLVFPKASVKNTLLIPVLGEEMAISIR